MIGRFVHDICGCGHDWNMPDYIAEAVQKIRDQVGDEEVILGLSGGVDSSVAAALIHRAIGDQLTCVFVDHGLLRLNEGEHGHGDVRRPTARQGRACRRRPTSSWATSKGVTDPEQKRKIIGREFVEVFQAEAQEAAEREVARPGHDLPRRDRVRRRQEQEGAHHQEPPQRRRPARDAAA